MTNARCRLKQLDCSTFCNSVENGGFSQKSKGETTVKSLKMAAFLGKLKKAKNIANTNGIIA